MAIIEQMKAGEKVLLVATLDWKSADPVATATRSHVSELLNASCDASAATAAPAKISEKARVAASVGRAVGVDAVTR
jgi:hypothetical protein